MTLTDKDKDYINNNIIGACFVIFAITLLVSIIVFEHAPKYDGLFFGHWENWSCENKTTPISTVCHFNSTENVKYCSIYYVKEPVCKQIWVKDE